MEENNRYLGLCDKMHQLPCQHLTAVLWWDKETSSAMSVTRHRCSCMCRGVCTSGFAWEKLVPEKRWVLYQFAEAATPEYHRWGDLNSKNSFPHPSGGQKPKIKVLVRLVSSEASLLGSQMAAFSQCPHISCPYDTSHNGLGPTLMTSFSLKITSLMTRPPNTVIFRGNGG